MSLHFICSLFTDKRDSFNGWGVTAFDSLDTMLLMGLEDEYARALELVKNADFTKSRVSLNSRYVPRSYLGSSPSQPAFVPFFETIIRYLAGLLSAYSLSKDYVLVQRAEELVTALDPVFNTPTGMPFFSVDPETCVE